MEFNKFIKPKIWLTAGLVICTLLGTGLSLKAQTYAEIFRQKRTQKKYLITQLLALKTYASYLKKGYNIASNGISTVKNFTNGEFNLHHSFISSLKTVSPIISNHNKVAEIILLQLKIGNTFKKIAPSGPSAITYVEEVKNGLMTDCVTELEELLLIISAGKAAMGDDERLRRLDKIYTSMLDKYAFAQHFCNQINLVNGQHKKELQSIKKLKDFYEID